MSVVNLLKRMIANPNDAKMMVLYRCPWLMKDDRKYIEYIWKKKMNYPLNLDNPQTFNEKLQWIKLYDHNPLYTKMVDKYEAKEYVASIIGDEYIIKTLGVWDRFDDIDFSTLPKQFVLKCTHDSGGLVICKDKSKLDIQAAKKKIEKSLKKNYYYIAREWPYKNVKRRIIAEEYIEDEKTKELRDYKFFCFNG
ncbi:MAG: glycosyl transferase, partial [Prevotella sp.]|nr:glycosyl transferase [Prevotella sp.]